MDIRGFVARLFSNTPGYSETASGQIRVGKNGDVSVLSRQLGLQNAADEGAYWVGTNPTIGTGIAGITTLTAWVTTTPHMILQNNDVVGGKNIIFDYIKVQQSAGQLPTSATDWRYAFFTDTIKRFSSGGTAVTPVNANTGATASTIAQLYWAATAAAASAQRQIKAGVVRSVIPVVLDQYEWAVGNGAGSHSSTAQNGTTPNLITIPIPPVVVAPQTSLLFYMWGTAHGAVQATHEFTVGWIER